MKLSNYKRRLLVGAKSFFGIRNGEDLRQVMAWVQNKILVQLSFHLDWWKASKFPAALSSRSSPAGTIGNLRSSFPEELRILRADKRTRCRILYLIKRTNRNILILLTRCCAIFLCYLGDGIYKGPINERFPLVGKLTQILQLMKRTGLLIFYWMF